MNSPYKKGSNKLSRPGQGYASFYLIQSEKNERNYSSQHRFEGKPFYEFSSLIAQNQKIEDLVIMDLVIMDEFNEPMHYMSMPLKIQAKHLFENELNLDMQAETSEAEVFSVEYESPIIKKH